MKASLFIKQTFGMLLFFAVIFISAGRFIYWQGLIYVFIGLSMYILSFTALRIDSELMNERSKPGEGAKQWDKLILGLSFLATIGMYIIAGLDSGHYHWSPDFHWSLFITGILLTILGQLLFLIAKNKINFFQVQFGFKQTEDIQSVRLVCIKLSDILLIWAQLSRQ